MFQSLLRLLLLTFLFGFSISSQAQDITLKKALGAANKMKEDTNKVIQLNAIAFEFKYQNITEIEALLPEIITLSKKLKYPSGIATAYKTEGILMDEKGDLPSAIECYNKSIRYYKKAKDEMGVAKCQANIGILYRDLKRNKEAIEQFQNSNKVFIKNDFLQGQLIINQNISICYENAGQNDSAFAYIEKAYQLMKKLGQEDFNVYGNYGNCYAAIKNYPKAIEYYEKAIEISGGDNRAVTWIDNLGTTYYKLKQYKKALPLVKKSIEFAPNIYTANTMTSHLHLASIYAGLGDFKNAFIAEKKYVEIRDSIFSVANSNQLSELSKKYETEKKQIEINSLKKQRTAKNKQLKSEQQQKYILAGALVIFALLGFMLFHLLRKQNAANKIISAQKEVVESQKTNLEHKNREILDSINYAKRLQDAILPAKDYWRNAFPDSFVLYKPKDIVAGDFYWMEQVNLTRNGQEEQLLFFAAADCTGHGVPGAMVSVVCCNALNRSVLEFGITDPGDILDKARELVIATFDKSDENVMDGMDISLCCLNKNTLELKWAGANNPLWYTNSSDEIIEIKPNKQPIGNYFELKAFTTHSLQLEKGTNIYLFTDGYADQFGGRDGKKFKYKQFKESILKNKNIDMSKQEENLDKIFESWKGELEQVDDVCIIGIQV